MKNALFLLLLTCSFPLAAQDNKVGNGPSQTKSAQQKATTNQPAPVVVSVKTEINQQPAKEDAKQEQAHPPEEISSWKATFWSAVIASLALAVAFGQFWYFGNQLRVMANTLEANKTSADAALIQAESIKLAERAYVKMSHKSGDSQIANPGLVLDENSNSWEVHIEIKNFGQTPARITDVAIEDLVLPKDGKLPDVPILPKPINPIQAFLVRDDFILRSTKKDYEGPNAWKIIPSLQDGSQDKSAVS